MSVAAGGQHSLALRSDGRVYAWGKPGSAQASAPANLADVVMISAGNSHAAALTRDGRVYSWGGASSYIVNVPENLGDIVSIVAGVDHSFAIDATGTAVGWGADGWHENSVPAAYRGQVLLASAGFQHSFLLLRDGSLQSWGSNVGYMRDYPSGLTGVYDLKGWSGHHLVLESAGPPGLYAPLPGADRNEGQPWKWEAHATGTDPRSYQWFKDGVAIPGQTSSTLNFEELELSDAGSYEVRVTNERGSVTSRPATLTVAPVPVITSQSPLRHVIVPGSDLALAVSATGAGALSYQWSHNGGDIESATSATFELTNANSADSGWYNVEITDDIGTRRSAAMFVQVVPPRTRIIGWGYNAGLASPTWPPAEDDFIEI